MVCTFGQAITARRPGALERRDFRQASEHFEKCLEVFPTDLTVRLAAAQTARRQGDFDKAAQHLHAYEEANGSREAVALEQQLRRAQSGDLEEADLLLKRSSSVRGVRKPGWCWKPSLREV